MTSRSKNSSAWLNIISVIGAMIMWFVFSPIQMGGSAGYVIINGNSMEPLYHSGDLVIVRRSNIYEIGNIAAYRHPNIGVVIHRIIKQDGTRFILKGDNNSWIDSYSPTPEEVVGKAEIWIPQAGKVLEQVRTPNALAGATILLGGSVLLTTIIPSTANGTTKRKRRANRRNNLQAFKLLNANQETLYFALGVLAFASFLLGIVGYTRPLTQTVSKNVPFEHRGKFSYSAPSANNIYDANSVRTGDPIFRQLTNVVNVAFEYQLSSAALKSTNGAYRLIAEISDSTNNWKRNIELQSPTQFSNGTFKAEGILDLNKIQALVTSVNQQTGVLRQQYSITIFPEIITQVTIGDQTLDQKFAPRLEFRVNDLEMYLASRGSGGSTPDPLNPIQAGLAHQSVIQPNILSIFGLNLEIEHTRTIAVVGFLLATAGMVVLWTLHNIAAASGEASLIQLKYGDSMISINSEDPTIGQQVIEVSTIDDLAKMAEHEGRMMLHGFYSDGDQYFVPGDTVVYRYAPNNAQKNEDVYLGAPEHEAMVESWVRAITMRKIEERTQLFKMADLTLRLARKVEVPDSQLVFIRWGVLLHDIGQIALPDQILLKPGPLSEDEWRLIRAHPTYARDVLAPTQALHPALDIPSMHHEKWDGTGYPRGLRGEAIPLAARLFSIVDVWVTMHAKRSYRNIYSTDQVRLYLQEQAGKQFDPRLVQAFLELEGI